MALILDGNGLIQGLSAGGLPNGSIDADSLASTLDLSSKTMTFGNVTASGITFPASVSASGNPNTLDDYEEGTWTPTLAFGTSGSVTYTSRIGQYVKIGNTVFVSFWIYGAGRSSPNGSTTITGFPFTSNGTESRPAAFLRTNQVSITGYVTGYMLPNATAFQLEVINNGGLTASLNGTSLSGPNFEFGVCLFYTV